MPMQTQPLSHRIQCTGLGVWLLVLGSLSAQEVEIGTGEMPVSVVVLPFANITGHDGDAWIGAGIAETVRLRIQRTPRLSAVGHADTGAVAQVGREPAVDEAAVLAVGRGSGARWLVAGGYQRLGDRLRVTGRYVDVSTGRIVRTIKVDGSVEELFALQDRIASDLIDDLASRAVSRPAAPPEETAVSTTPDETGEPILGNPQDFLTRRPRDRD